MTSPCIHGFRTEECTSCRSCPHGLVTSLRPLHQSLQHAGRPQGAHHGRPQLPVRAARGVRDLLRAGAQRVALPCPTPPPPPPPALPSLNGWRYQADGSQPHRSSRIGRSSWPARRSTNLLPRDLSRNRSAAADSGGRHAGDWRAREDSNLRPSGPQPDALSTELRARATAMAEREGFEPSEEETPFNGLANRRTRPLCDLSASGADDSMGPSERPPSRPS